MLIDINPNIELPEYSLVLHKLNEEAIQELHNITDLTYSPFFVGIDELSFNVPLYRQESDGTLARNEIYDLIEGDYLVKLNDEQFFIVTKVEEISEEDGTSYKAVECFSREYELGHKKLVDYEADSRMLYDIGNSIVEEDGLELGIMNYIFNHITMAWTIAQDELGRPLIDSSLLEKGGKPIHRALNFSNSNLLQVFQELQKTFNCVFVFDTIEQTISIFDIENMLGKNRGLYISDDNFIKNLNKSINYDEIKTRLYLYGKDNVSIQSISPTGQPYIDNFDTYMKAVDESGNPKYMTPELIEALENYYEKVRITNPDFVPLLEDVIELKTDMEELINKDSQNLNEKGMVALERELSIVRSLIDVQIEAKAIKQNTIRNADGTELPRLHAEMKLIENEISELGLQETNINSYIAANQVEINEKQIEISNTEELIQEFQNELDLFNEDNFSQVLLEELDRFIRVETLSDSNYEEHNIDELYERGRRELNRISQPPIQFDVNVVDFLNLVECQHAWDKFILGDIVNLQHRDLNFDYEVRLINYTHSVDDNDLNLVFSNKNTVDDATLYLRDLLEDFKTTSVSVDFNKYKWDETKNIKNEIIELVDIKLEQARQGILTAVGQKHLFDDSGLWLYKENEDGTIDKEQIRAINNTIALTENNWESIGTAITPQGIVAENIYGKIGNLAHLNAGQVQTGLLKSEDHSTWINLDDGTFSFKDAIKHDGNKFSISLSTEDLPIDIEDFEQYNIILSNENDSFPTNVTGTTYESVVIESDIITLKGINKTQATIGDIVLKDINGQTIDNPGNIYGVISKRNPSSSLDGFVKWEIPMGVNLPNNSGHLEIPVTIDGNTYKKKLTWNKSIPGKDGEDGIPGKDGEDGIPGENAKLVKITSSEPYFIKEFISQNSYTTRPSEITLTPHFQNTSFAKWEYSTNAGSTWSNIGTTIYSTLPYRNSYSNVTTIPRGFYNNRDSAIFRVTSTDGQFDLVTINVIPDVSQLEQRVSSAELEIDQVEGKISTKVAEEVTKGTKDFVKSSEVEQLVDKVTYNFNSVGSSIPPFRYIRVSKYCNESSYLGWAYFSNLSIWNSNGTDVAKGKTVTTNSSVEPASGGNIQNYTDGHELSGASSSVQFWSSRSFSNMYYLEVDLGSVQNDIVKIKDFSPNDRNQYTKIEVRDSSFGDWRRLYSGDSTQQELIFDTDPSVDHMETGITTINKDGIKVTHTGLGGQYSEIKADGFVRKWRYGEAKYLNDIFIADFEYIHDWATSKPAPAEILFPPSFRGRGNEVEVVVALSEMIIDGTRVDNYGNVRFAANSTFVELNIDSINWDLTRPKVKVNSYTETSIQRADGTRYSQYLRIGFVLIAIGK